MKLKTLKLNYFRIYDNVFFEFNDNLNIIYGDNGTGKTTLLEAIHFLSLTKSFRAGNDTDVIKYKQDYFQIFGQFTNSKKTDISVNLNYSKCEGKKVFLNKNELKRKTDIIGKIPVIILSPGTQRITDGGPLIRRNFIDRILAQINKEYLIALMEYKKRIYQRNILLNKYREQKTNKYDKYIETIDEIIIDYAYIIQRKRSEYIESFNTVLKEVFQKISHFNKEVTVKINPNINVDLEIFKNVFREKLADKFEKDILLGRTGTGPHLDHILLLFGDRDIRFTGSHGEHKILLVSLKISEGIYIEKSLNEKVIFLLDDLFAMLDVTHCMNILKEIGKQNQTLVTTTDITVFKKYGFDFKKYNAKTFGLPIGFS
jgi:DNA replication and repair protein RecF